MRILILNAQLGQIFLQVGAVVETCLWCYGAFSENHNEFIKSLNNTKLNWKCLTCALVEAGPLFHNMTAEFTTEVVFPELSKPDIPSVVFQCSTDEVTIKPWTDQ